MAEERVTLPADMRSLFQGLASLLVLGSSALSAQDLDWPQFRGPQGNGITTSTNLPLSWAEDRNVKWKTPIHGKAWSSPVIWGNQLWVTTATPDGKELSVVCADPDR